MRETLRAHAIVRHTLRLFEVEPLIKNLKKMVCDTCEDLTLV